MGSIYRALHRIYDCESKIHHSDQFIDHASSGRRMGDCVRRYDIRYPAGGYRPVDRVDYHIRERIVFLSDGQYRRAYGGGDHHYADGVYADRLAERFYGIYYRNTRADRDICHADRIFRYSADHLRRSAHQRIYRGV